MSELHQLEAIARHGWPQTLAGPLQIEPCGGGLGPNRVWKVATRDRSFALRYWPGDQRRHAEQVARLLWHVDRRRPGWVPAPLRRGGATGSEEFLAPSTEGVWELAPWLAGEADFPRYGSPARAAAVGTALAELHGWLAEVPIEGSRQVEVAARSKAQLADVEQLVDSGSLHHATPVMIDWGWPVAFPAVEAALAAGCQRVKRTLMPLGGERLPRQWCWGDAWVRNVLFEGERVSALVDFAAARGDTTVADLARMLGSLGDERWGWRAIALEAYGERRPLGERELRAAAALEDLATVVSLANWCRWLAIDKHAVAHPQLVCDRVSHFVGRLRRLVDR